MSTMLADEKQRLKTYMKYMDSLEDDLISLQARRIKMSNQQFRDVTYHNWWLTGKQALKYNVVDILFPIYFSENFKWMNSFTSWYFFF